MHRHASSVRWAAFVALALGCWFLLAAPVSAAPAAPSPTSASATASKSPGHTRTGATVGAQGPSASPTASVSPGHTRTGAVPRGRTSLSNTGFESGPWVVTGSLCVLLGVLLLLAARGRRRAD